MISIGTMSSDQRIRIFGRKAEMNPVPLNLNRQVDEVTKFLTHPA
jgi:hypothetical protein